MFCWNCGKKQAVEEAKFCFNCGSALAGQVEPAASIRIESSDVEEDEEEDEEKEPRFRRIEMPASVFLEAIKTSNIKLIEDVFKKSVFADYTYMVVVQLPVEDSMAMKKMLYSELTDQELEDYLEFTYKRHQKGMREGFLRFKEQMKEMDKDGKNY